jgi:hypothetical protein
MRSIAASCLFIAACGDASAQPMREVTPPNASVEDGIYESSPWNGTEFPYLEYPGDTRLLVNHTLLRNPRIVLVYVSFEEDGRRAALAAGDIARIEHATADTVLLHNATEQRFWLRLVLQ